MKRIVALSIALTCLISSCKGQNSNEEKCKKHFENSKKALNYYYSEQNQKQLDIALQEVELSLSCSETRRASIDLKISILSLQKSYVRALNFVESLNIKDFNKPYKKGMQSNFFQALCYELKSDLKNRNLYFDKAIVLIENYIKEQKSIDEEAYYDLFLVKSKVLTKKQIDSYIVELVKEHPKDKGFFELLKESFNEESKEISSQ